MSAIGIDFQVSYKSVQGGREYMEDVVSIKMSYGANSSLRCFAFFAVFDGHGGVDAARFADKHLLHQITRRAEFWSEDDGVVVQAIKDGFLATHNMMTKAVDTWPRTHYGLPSTAGTTASVAILMNSKLYVAHVGDSSVVLGERVAVRPTPTRNAGRLTGKFITEAHKPDNSKERRRIESCGGEVLAKAGVNRVVWKRSRQVESFGRRSIVIDTIPFLTVSRSLGDLWSYRPERDVYIVSPEPDVAVFNIDSRHQRCLVIASDGLWDMVSATEATDYISCWNGRSQMAKTHDGGDYAVHQPAAGLVQLAVNRWSTRGLKADNISAIIVMFGLPDDLITDVPNDEIPQTDEPATSSYSTARTRRFSRSSPPSLRAAIHKRWRLDPGSRLLARARGIRVAMDSFQRLHNPPAKSDRVDSSEEDVQSSPTL